MVADFTSAWTPPAVGTMLTMVIPILTTAILAIIRATQAKQAATDAKQAAQEVSDNHQALMDRVTALEVSEASGAVRTVVSESNRTTNTLTWTNPISDQ